MKVSILLSDYEIRLAIAQHLREVRGVPMEVDQIAPRLELRYDAGKFHAKLEAETTGSLAEGPYR